MKFNTFFKASLLSAFVLGGISAPTLASDVDDTIKLRKVIMASVRWAGVNIMGAATPENKRQEQNFIGQASQMVAATEMITVVFKTKALGKDSSVKTHVMETEEIWHNWEDFTNRAGQLLADARAIEALAKAGDFEGAKAATGKAFKSNCKGCHDKFQDN